jgi:hypothetical protein
MNCAALTGISPVVISELKKGKPRTLELHSAHNIITLTNVSPGEMIFLTDVDLDDLGKGDGGIMADVLAVTVSMKRVVEYINPIVYEEKERMSARIQIRYVGSTYIKDVAGKKWFEPTSVEIVKSSCYHGR